MGFREVKCPAGAPQVGSEQRGGNLAESGVNMVCLPAGFHFCSLYDFKTFVC